MAAPVVLLVDDDPEVRQVLARALEADGMTVVEASTGGEALRILKGDPSIDVLVTDVMMPGITGNTLVEQAAKLRPDLKTLMVTAYAPAGLVRYTTTVMTKPFRIAELCQRVRTLCGLG
jgi:CheY-like chemotaxis protein